MAQTSVKSRFMESHDPTGSRVQRHVTPSARRSDAYKLLSFFFIIIIIIPILLYYSMASESIGRMLVDARPTVSCDAV